MYYLKHSNITFCSKDKVINFLRIQFYANDLIAFSVSESTYSCAFPRKKIMTKANLRKQKGCMCPRKWTDIIMVVHLKYEVLMGCVFARAREREREGGSILFSAHILIWSNQTRTQ